MIFHLIYFYHNNLKKYFASPSTGSNSGLSGSGSSSGSDTISGSAFMSPKNKDIRIKRNI